jgi:hypothetical protein
MSKGYRFTSVAQPSALRLERGHSRFASWSNDRAIASRIKALDSRDMR